MRHRALMRFYQSFPTAIPLYEAGYPRVTHPSATQSLKFQSEEIDQSASFDLHVLSTPPAFILSQDQTLIKKFVNPMSEIILACIFPNHLYCYWFVRSLISSPIRRSWNSCLEFQGCHVVNFSRFFMFSPLSDNFYMLSHLKFFVNNFFIFFSRPFRLLMSDLLGDNF